MKLTRNRSLLGMLVSLILFFALAIHVGAGGGQSMQPWELAQYFPADTQIYVSIRTDIGFLDQLDAAGLLAGDARGAVAEEDLPCPSDRPLSVLSGYRLSCDGRGGCCRQYASTLFSPVEAARARAVLPMVAGGGERHERVFSPERGAAFHAASAVAMVDGRCAYLASDDRCGLHAEAGPLAKPLGCQLFPATFVDDGDEVRVSVAVECACVLSSLDAPEQGSPIIAESACFRGDLDEAAFVSALPSRIDLTATGLRGPGLIQRTLFEPESDPRKEAIFDLKRKVNAEMGRFTLRSGATLPLSELYRDPSCNYDICDVRGKICF